MKKIYHHYSKWEEHHNGMWRSVHGQQKEEYLRKAIEFTGDADLYGSWMMKVIEAWPYSTEMNMTDSSMNRQAWVGHAACCMAIGCPESITRVAWHYLTQEQQDKANAKADQAIAEWERRYKDKVRELCQNLNLEFQFCEPAKVA